MLLLAGKGGEDRDEGRTACGFQKGLAGGDVSRGHDHVEEAKDEEGRDFETGKEGSFYV